MIQLEYLSRVTSVLKVTDGDTYWLYVDRGFRAMLLVETRILGFDTPETRKGSPYERAQGKLATHLAANWWIDKMATPGKVWTRTEPDPDDFGRWLAQVWHEDPEGNEEYLGDRLRAARLASIWPTRWREEFDDTI